MNKTKGLDFIKRYTMILVLIVVTAFFAWRTGGAILLPMNVSSLISPYASNRVYDRSTVRITPRYPQNHSDG